MLALCLKFDVRRVHMQCVLDDGLAERRICRYHNLMMYQSRLLYMYSGMACHCIKPRPEAASCDVHFANADSAPPDLPEVMVNWHTNKTVHVTPMHTSQIPQSWKRMQVIICPTLFSMSCHGLMSLHLLHTVD